MARVSAYTFARRKVNVSDVRILIVEDNLRYRETVNRSLRGFYPDLDFADSIEEARRYLETKYYDVIVTDMRLQSDSSGGFGVVDWVEEHRITSAIIVLTANETVDDCRRACAAALDIVGTIFARR